MTLVTVRLGRLWHVGHRTEYRRIVRKTDVNHEVN